MKMDKNTIFGLVIIAAILIGFSLWNKPSQKELAARKKTEDSLRKIQKQDSLKLVQNKAVKESAAKKTDTTAKSNNKAAVPNPKDTTKAAVAGTNLGLFSKATTGEKAFYTIENELLKIKLASKGGRVYSVELKKFKTYDKRPLILFDGDSTVFNINFYTENKNVSTKDLYFRPFWYGNAKGNHLNVKGTDSISFGMRLYADTSARSDTSKKYIEYLYTLKGNSYMMGMKINFSNMQSVFAANTMSMPLDWMVKPLPQEKDVKTERNASTIYYKFLEDDVDYLSETTDKQKNLETKVKWIGFKQQFFTSVFIADKSFNNAKIETKTDKENPKYVKQMSASIDMPYDNTATCSIPTHFYFGPTQYKTLRQYHLDLERQIPLGWSFFLMQWINRFAVIPVFNFLEGFNINYGIIILILTILLKIVLFPIAFRTYKSSAKMRVLKPEIDEIGQKFPKKEDAMKKQQATMALYKKAGVNPMAGCLPMLLQFPILISLFRFFPASIELRQQSFLWATDLSTYDSIWNFGFNVPFYGDHMSLFTLLMTVSTIIYTKINSDMMGQTNQMPGMKVMMYLMPVVFLGVFNSFAAGLSYYYFLANVITFGQMYVIRRFIEEEAIHRQIQENRKKPDAPKKSGFQQRLEEMAKKRGYNPKK